MMTWNQHLITLMVFLPMVGAVLQAFLPERPSGSEATRAVGRWVALGLSLSASLLAVALFISMHAAGGSTPIRESFDWISSYSIRYEMVLDGLNVLPVLLIAIVFPLLIASEWRQPRGVRGMYALFLILQGALFGAVCAQDLFLLFFFWALSSVPFYFLIGVWGESRKEEAAMQFAVSSTLGNALLFAALVLIYYSVDPHSFSIEELSKAKLSAKSFGLLGYEVPSGAVAFGLISIGLALRAPVWPLHGWFTRVAEEAPASVFVALCAVTLSVATSLFVRLGYSLFPETLQAASGLIVGISVVNLLFGSICAFSQKALKPLLAYASIAGMGFLLLGAGSMTSSGVTGAVFGEISLGLGLAGLGLFAGLVKDRVGHDVFATPEGQSRFGGLATQAPVAALVCGVIIATLLGIPGTGGFIGDSLLAVGVASSSPGAVVACGVSLILSTYFFFSMFRHFFLGAPSQESLDQDSQFLDLSGTERMFVFPLIFCILLLGFYPKPFLDLVRPTVEALMAAAR